MVLCENISSRLREDAVKGKTVTLKVRLEGFHTYTRSRTLPEAINFEDVLYKEVKRLYNEFDRKSRKIRLLGVKVSNLSRSGFIESLFAKDLFDKKRENIHQAIDKIKKRFGTSSIRRAISKM